jgi:hypothetical protein
MPERQEESLLCEVEDAKVAGRELQPLRLCGFFSKHDEATPPPQRFLKVPTP